MIYDAITAEEIIREQAVHRFCIDVRHRMDSENLKSFTTEAPEFQGTLCGIASEYMQTVVPQLLKERALGGGHYAELAGHRSVRNLYKSQIRHFYWPTKSVYRVTLARNCIAGARERVKLLKNAK